jgi:hypothetical protein
MGRLVTIFTTILAGVSVFVVGQVFLKWIIEPIQELRKLKGEILFHLANDHATIHSARIVDRDAAHDVADTLCRLGASLLATIVLIPMYSRIRKYFFLPEAEKVRFAAKRLRLIANSMHGDESDIHYKLDIYRLDVCDALGIEDPVQNGMSRRELSDAVREIREQRRDA